MFGPESEAYRPPEGTELLPYLRVITDASVGHENVIEPDLSDLEPEAGATLPARQPRPV